MFLNKLRSLQVAATLALVLTASIALADKPSKPAPEIPIKPVPLAEPTATDVKIARAVVMILENAHYTRHPVDEEISKRLHQLYLDSWDPTKRYYLQSDIDEFAKFEKTTAPRSRKAISNTPSACSSATANGSRNDSSGSTK